MSDITAYWGCAIWFWVAVLIAIGAGLAGVAMWIARLIHG
jgi:hypothetical protein